MTQAEKPPLLDFLWYFLKLGTFGFGGPIALAEHMERDLVEQRGWITPEDYKQGLALSQLAPGPLAAQLGIYLGYVHSGVLGATLVGLAFVAPSFAMVIAIASAYSAYGGLRSVQALFYGIGAAVMGIIARSAYKLAKATVGNKPLLWAIFAIMALVTVAARRELASLFFLSGIVSLCVYAPPRWLQGRGSPLLLSWIGFLAPQGQAAVSSQTLLTVFTFFAKSGLFVFGSGLAIVPFLYGGVVNEHHWLNERQFLDAVAVAMITPGPVVITVAFIGYLVAGLAGATLAAAGVFLPVWGVVVCLAPWFRRHANDPQIKAFVDGVTAAAVGALAGAAVVIGRGAVRDVPTALIAMISLLALIRLKIPEPSLVGAAGIAGLFLFKG